MDKHKTNKKKEKMFNFRTTILMTVFVLLSMLHTHTTEGKVQMIHRHNTRNNNNNNNNDNNNHKDNADDVIKQNQKHHHYPHHHHHHHHHQHPHLHTHSHHSHHESQQRKYAATPILEFTTSSSSAIQSDNEFLIKQQQQQQQQKQENELQQQQQQQPEEISFINNKDEVYYKTIKRNKFILSSSSSSTSSTTSQPSFSIHLMKQDDNNKTKSETSISNSIMEQHKRHRHYNRSIPMALLKHHNTGADKSHSDSGRNGDNVDTVMVIDPSENSKWNIATDQKITKENVQQQHPNHQQQQQQQRIQAEKYKPDYDREQHSKHIYEDYYSDDSDGDGSEKIRYDEEDDTDEDDYIGDDNDNISYDDEKSLSDRSYARITRSQIDDDYADDEPHHNGINDLEMQSDAAPGTLTEQKYLEVGSERAVQQARERYILEQKKTRSPHELATEHWHRMIQATKCRKPMPRVIPVSNNTSKRYEPYATILHRCGDDTGCCGSTATVCTVKRYETVLVYVFSYDFNYRKEIEALPMQNHTECHCVNRGSLQLDSIPRDKRSGSRYFNHFQQRQRQQKPQLQSQLDAQYQEHQQPQLQNSPACNCPKHFNVFEEDIERRAHLPTHRSIFFRKCRCDCVISNANCLRFKNGEEGFSLEDRKCILEQNCKPPVCSYGDYNLRIGRCPNYKSHLLQMS